MADRRREDRRRSNQDSLLDDKQVAMMAGVSVRTVRYWRLSGVLPFVKVGRHPRIWRSEFQKVFHQPKPDRVWVLADSSGKIASARDIRRKS
jgi:excisionase family DNA binding protein